VGISDEQIRNLNYYAESSLFDADEKLVLELSDAITATPARVSPELRQRLHQRFSTAQLVELSAAIAWENYRARSNRVFDFASEGFYHPAVEAAGQQKPVATGAVSRRG
jgi:alkylhydroperoxidase family enzyme